MSEPKQVIVMRTDLKMRKGKMIAQGAHASMKVLLDRLIIHNAPGGFGYVLDVHEPDMAKWMLGSFVKVCVRVDSEEELLRIVRLAEQHGVPHALIEDEGRTEFNGVKTLTCAAIGPASPEALGPITNCLKLL